MPREKHFRVVFIPVDEWIDKLRSFTPKDFPGTKPEELFSAGELASGDFTSAVYDANSTSLEGDEISDEVYAEGNYPAIEPFAVVPIEVDGKLYHCVYFK